MLFLQIARTVGEGDSRRAHHERPESCEYSTRQPLRPPPTKFRQGTSVDWPLSKPSRTPRVISASKLREIGASGICVDPPLVTIIYAGIIVWFAREGHRHWKPHKQNPYYDKPHESLRDTLNILRIQTVKRHAFKADTIGPETKKLTKTLENIVKRAA